MKDMDSVENKPARSLVESSGKLLIRMPLALYLLTTVSLVVRVSALYKAVLGQGTLRISPLLSD